MKRLRLRVLLLFALMTMAPPLAAAPEGSGLPVPRFVSLRAGEANMRSGPGEQYPIKWVYRRPGVPLEIVAEYHHWRRVRDWQGTEGWMHGNMLAGRRSAVVLGETRMLRARANSVSGVVARLEPGVIAKLVRCPQDSAWCEIEAESIKGWLPRVDLWGVYPDETVE
jgi:SH3-like domain-containing protein